MLFVHLARRLLPGEGARRHVVSGLLLLLALWLALGLAIRWDAESERRAAYRQTAALADLLEAHTTRLLRQAEQLSAFVAWEVQRHGVALPLQRYVRDNVIRLDAFLQVAVIDANGMLRASTVAGFVPVDLSDREHFRVHVESVTEGLFIGKPLVGRASGKPSIQLSQRVVDERGRFLGVVVISMDPSYLTRLYDDLPMGSQGAISVLGAQDYVIRARRSGPMDAVGMAVPALTGLRQAMSSGDSGSYESMSAIDGVVRFSSFKRLTAFPLIVTVGFARDDYLAAYRSRRDFLLAAGGAMSLLILFASAYQGRMFLRTLVAVRRERVARQREEAKADRIHALFEAIPHPAMGLSRDMRLDGFNHRLLTLLGVTRSAIWDASTDDIAAAFFRHDNSEDSAAKAGELASALRRQSPGPTIVTVRMQCPLPLVFEIQIEPRRGGGTLALIRDITQQTDLSESERDLDTTLYAISDAVISTDARGRVKRMNRMAEVLTGWTAASARGCPATRVLRLAEATGRLCDQDPVSAVLQSGCALDLEDLRVCKPAGNQMLHVTVRAAPIPDHRGAVSGVVLVVHDVTSEREALARLRASEHRYRMLIDLLPCAVLVQQGGKLRYANQMAVSLLRAPSLPALIGREMRTLIQHEAEASPARQSGSGVGRPAASAVEQRWLRLDGSALQCEVTAVPYEWDGESAGLVLLQDIGARKLAERQRDRFFELSLDLQCIVRDDGYFDRVNPAFAKVLGWSAEALLARPFLNFVHADDRPATRREAGLQAGGAITQAFEIRFLCGNGDYRWLEWSAVREPDGLVYATARDVTESRAARQHLMHAKAEAESASRAKSAFLATMSHEIRTPMNGVVGLIEVLGQTPLSDDQANLIDTIRESACALLRIIDDILDFSKIEAGRMEIEAAPVSLRHLAASLCASLRPVAAKAKVSLTHSISPDVPEYVLSDAIRLRQLLNNLVGNAIKFSSANANAPGRVELIVEADGGGAGCVRFRVRDNGIGIAADQLKQLFMPFTQAEVSTTRRFGGTGLGLAICRRIVELLGGEITVESELHHGATFTVTLPLQAAQPLPAVPQPQPDRSGLSGPANRHRSIVGPAGGKGGVASPSYPCVLVAEDDPTNQKVILRQLDLLGYRAEIAGDGVEALEHWQSGRYALILTDLHMPVLDGYELARRVRAQEGDGHRIPILALTANAMQGEMKRAISAGMDGYLTKPLHLAALDAELQRWLPGCALPRPQALEPHGDAGQREAAPAVDMAVLVGLVGDDQAVVQALLDDFATALQRHLEALHGHRGTLSMQELGAIAHKLKSAARSVGAAPLGELCAKLENAARAEKHEDMARHLAAVQAESARVLAALAAMTTASCLGTSA